MNLGELSDKLKGVSVQKGSVFKMTFFPKDGVAPKNASDTSRTKYFVIIGKDKDSILVGSLLINTDVNINLSTIIAPYQHCIYPKDYSFLGNQHRYIDCYRIKEIEFGRIVDDAEYIGTISQADVLRAIQLANASPVNKPLTLKKFGIYQDTKGNQ